MVFTTASESTLGTVHLAVFSEVSGHLLCAMTAMVAQTGKKQSLLTELRLYGRCEESRVEWEQTTAKLIRTQLERRGLRTPGQGEQLHLGSEYGLKGRRQMLQHQSCTT